MNISEAADRIKQEFPTDVLGIETFCGQTTILVKREHIVEILKILRDNFGFVMLTDLCGLDYLNQNTLERFAVAYHLYSFKDNVYQRVKAFIPENDPSIDSVSSLWLSANWAERESYDMYGITFKGHPDLRRILLPENYGSYPLRKEYPVTGKGERDNFQKIY